MYITQYNYLRTYFYRVIQLCRMIQANHIKYSIETQCTMYCNFTEYHVCYNTRFTGCTRIPGFRVYQDTRFTGCTMIYQVYRVYQDTRFTGCTRIYLQVYRVYQDIPGLQGVSCIPYSDIHSTGCIEGGLVFENKF